MSLDHHAFQKLRIELLQATVTFQNRNYVLQNQRRTELKVYMNKDANPQRPRVFVEFGDNGETSICVKTKKVLAGSMRSALVESVTSWVAEHEGELVRTWDKIQKGKKPELLWVQ